MRRLHACMHAVRVSQRARHRRWPTITIVTSFMPCMMLSSDSTRVHMPCHCRLCTEGVIHHCVWLHSMCMV